MRRCLTAGPSRLPPPPHHPRAVRRYTVRVIKPVRGGGGGGGETAFRVPRYRRPHTSPPVDNTVTWTRFRAARQMSRVRDTIDSPAVGSLRISTGRQTLIKFPPPPSFPITKPPEKSTSRRSPPSPVRNPRFSIPRRFRR